VFNRGWIAVALAAVAFALAADYADAKRLGGGRSLGAQRQSIAPPASAPSAPAGAASNPVMPATPGAAMARPAAPTPAASGASRWLGPLAGIAAGIGLAALLSHFGLSEGFASMLLLLLVIGGGFVLVRMLFARRQATAPPLRYAGPDAAPAFGAAREPAWGGAPRVEPALRPQPVASPSPAKPLPPGFDADAFARQATAQFTRIQAAWDRGDRAALADVMTPEMQAEVGRDLAERGVHQPSAVVALKAEVLEVTTEGDRHWASVRYTGTLREDGGAATPFEEVWNLTKPVDDSTGWLLAGIQQLA